MSWSGLEDKIKTWYIKSVKYHVKDLLYVVQNNANIDNVEVAVNDFGAEKVFPEINIYLDVMIKKYEKWHNDSIEARNDWAREHRKIRVYKETPQGQANPRYPMKQPRMDYFRERAKKHKKGMGIHQKLYHTLNAENITNAEAIQNYISGRKQYWSEINKLPTKL